MRESKQEARRGKSSRSPMGNYEQRATGRNRANFLKKPIFGAKREGAAQDYYSRVDSSK